ncbi:hypothetical protein [Pseudoalteromonas luteoviolacea]|uniref:hypothetical protein n=1 Tax=Pseudoalteromonas luteoviolacea TaxID=43657 RepID=UPI00114F2BF4|nr:hypothetical protein [Pseudoalteromonas luteoviolacea]TQF71342.1 hypothetical protein FLM44_09700 [Pseudoalteromonas luteoviolacea]
MKNNILYLIFFALAVVSVVAYQKTDFTSASRVTNEKTLAYVQKKESSQELVKPSNSESMHEKSPIEELIEKLAKASLTEIKPLIESFWRVCLKQSTCDELLSDLHTNTSFEKYQLVAQYPTKQQEFKVLTQSEDFNTSTVEKVERIKSIYVQVWGDIASEVFHEAFSFYDTRAMLAELTDKGNELEYNDFIEQLDTLGQQGRISLDKSEQYSIAIEVLGANMSPSKLSELKSQLAMQYFGKEQAEAIVARQYQVIEQQKTVQNYHQALKQKKAQLELFRETEFSDLTEQQWRNHYAAEIKAFRKAFFN